MVSEVRQFAATLLGLCMVVGCSNQSGLTGGSNQAPKQEETDEPEATPDVDPLSQLTPPQSFQSNTDENLTALPPQVVGGAYLTTTVYCGEVTLTNPLPADKAPFGCLVVDKNNAPISFEGNRLDWDLRTTNNPRLALLQRAIAYRQLEIPTGSPYAALFEVYRSDLEAGIATGLTVTGKDASGELTSVTYEPVLDIGTQQRQTGFQPPPQVIEINNLGI